MSSVWTVPPLNTLIFVQGISEHRGVDIYSLGVDTDHILGIRHSREHAKICPKDAVRTSRRMWIGHF